MALGRQRVARGDSEMAPSTATTLCFSAQQHPPTGMCVGSLIRRLASLAFVFAVVQSPAHVAYAEPPDVTEAQLAALAYEKHEFHQSALGYLKAWRIGKNPEFLLASGRAHEAASHLDLAMLMYQQFIELPGLPAAQVKRAKRYLEVTHNIIAAKSAVRQRDFASAFAYFDAAARLAPERPDLLYKAGVCQEHAGDLALATAYWKAFLERAPSDASERGQARARSLDVRTVKLAKSPELKLPPAAHDELLPFVHARIAQASEAEELANDDRARYDGRSPAPPAAMTVEVASKPRPSQWPRWAVIGGGTALIAAGTVLFATTASEAAQFQRDTQPDANNRVVGMTRQTANQRADSINMRMGVAGGLTGVGAIAAFVGVWWLLHDRPGVLAVLPVDHGLQLSGRF